MCGEHLNAPGEKSISNGSSPHVRGTSYDADLDAFALRFIPACAGNINYEAAFEAMMAVHPRMCGEHFDVISIQADGDGSSPHVRGTWVFSQIGLPGVRFIPACAGNISRRGPP